MKTCIKIGKWIIVVLVAIIIIGIVGAALSDNESKEENSPKQTEAFTTEKEEEDTPKQTEGFTTEHDQEYLNTREHVWSFLLDKGYEVQTTLGVPNIGKTDADLGEGYEGWYAFVKQDGEWKEFSVVLFNGEVSAIQPVE